MLEGAEDIRHVERQHQIIKTSIARHHFCSAKLNYDEMVPHCYLQYRNDVLARLPTQYRPKNTFQYIKENGHGGLSQPIEHSRRTCACARINIGFIITFFVMRQNQHRRNQGETQNYFLESRLNQMPFLSPKKNKSKDLINITNQLKLPPAFFLYFLVTQI